MDFTVLQEMSLQGYFICAVLVVGFVAVFWRLTNIYHQLQHGNGERRLDMRPGVETVYCEHGLRFGDCEPCNPDFWEEDNY